MESATKLNQVHPYIYGMIPEAAKPCIDAMIRDYDVIMMPSRNRTSKTGDYRAPYNGWPHRITLNVGLNPYAALITLVHEIAHMHVHALYGRKVEPHGVQWKQRFAQLILSLPPEDFFPAEIAERLRIHMRAPKASTFTDHALVRLLQAHNDDMDQGVLVEALPEGTVFCLNGNRWFRKGPKQRTRFKCIDLSNNKAYLIHPLAKISGKEA